MRRGQDEGIVKTTEVNENLRPKAFILLSSPAIGVEKAKHSMERYQIAIILYCFYFATTKDVGSR